ncbi:MAG: glycosyltransferase family 2 protein, partial [Phaeodactylibacter sp.]|nr:glycosyltransferase family 2 protein [Phaeodactylibacter sp.]
MDKAVIDVIIPAFNEEQPIGLVLREIPWEAVREVVVCNNASTDRTAEVAKAGGATVLYEARKGYGNACLKGIEYLVQKPASEKPDIVVFMDADYSDFPDELPSLVNPIIEESYDLAIGSRTLGRRQRGALLPQQLFGNWLATTLIRLFYNYHFTDLGPFRAIRFDKLLALKMKDRNYGWTVEM